MGLMSSLLALIVKLVDVYSMLIVVYVLLSWIPAKQGFLQTIDDALGKLCEPYLQIFRKSIPPIGGTIDISPIIALLALQLLVRILYWIF